MNKKQLEAIACKIYVLENRLAQDNITKEEKQEIEDKIVEISSSITNINDFFYIDNFISRKMKK